MTQGDQAGTTRSSSLPHKIVTYWGDHYRLDRLAVLAVGVHAFLYIRFEAGDPLGALGASERADFYISLAQVLGIVVAFSVTALAFYQVEPGPRLRVLQRQAGAKIVESWLSAITAGMGILALLIGAAIAENAGSLPQLRWVVLAGLYFLLVRGIRMTWILWQVLLVDEADRSAPRGRSAPKIKRKAQP